MPSTLSRTTKRQRITQACETCRKRKSKCDGTQPICVVCSTNSRICTYDAANRKRGLQVGYVRGIEMILGLLLRDVAGAEQRLRVLLRSPDVRDEFFTSSFVEEVTEIWHHSQLHNDIKTLLRNHEGGTETVTGYLTPLISQEDWSLSSITPALPPQTQTRPAQLSTGILQDDVSIPEDAAVLVDWYFLHIHCWLPIISRRDVLYIIHSASVRESNTIGDHGLEACLLAMMALSLTSQGSPTVDRARVQQLRKTTKARLVESEQDFECGHIQATLLLAVLDIYNNLLVAGWIEVGKAARMLEIYAAKQQMSNERLPHLSQACEWLDVFLSTMLGRRSHLGYYDSATPAVDETGVEEWETWPHSLVTVDSLERTKRLPLHSLSIFNRITTLMRLLRRLHTSLLERHSVQTALDELATWKKALPSFCSFAITENPNPCLLGLNLAYKFAVLSIAASAGSQSRSLAAGILAARAILNDLQLHTDILGFSRPFLHHYAQKAIDYLKDLNIEMDDLEVGQLILGLDDVQKSLSHGWVSQLVVDKSKYPHAATSSTILASPATTRLHHHPSVFGNELLAVGESGLSQIQSLTSHQRASGTGPVLDIVQNNIFPSQVVLPIQDTLREGTTELQALIAENTDMVTDNDFDALLDELPPFMDYDGPSQQQFANNLGLLIEDPTADFWALLDIADRTINGT